MRVLAIGAHPDDIEIACSGTLAKCVKRGYTVIVCHVSDGNLGHVVIPPDELRVIRANEAKRAGALAGIEVIGADGMLGRGMQWQGMSLRMTLRYGKTPWVTSSYIPTLPGRLFFLKELAGSLVAKCN